MPFNLHLLRVFLLAAEHANFSRAARALLISQPAVSKSIQDLETQIGLPLFDRSRRVLTLTEAGRLLYQYAQHLFAVEKSAEVALKQLKSLEHGHLVIGASQTIGTDLLPPILTRFHRAYPGIKLALEIANTQAILENLRTKPYDVAFVEGPVRDGGLDLTIWRTDRLVAICAPTHPLANQPSVTLHRFAAEPYVQREAGSGTRDIVESALREHGIQLDAVIELQTNQAVKQMVSAGFGVSIVSEATVTLEIAARTLAIIPLEDVQFDRPLWQVLVKDQPLSPAASAFIDFAASG